MIVGEWTKTASTVLNVSEAENFECMRMTLP